MSESRYVDPKIHDMDLIHNKKKLKEDIAEKLRCHFGETIESASQRELYKAAAMVVRDTLMQRWLITKERRKQKGCKRLYYLSVEFLIGRLLQANLRAIGREPAFAATMRDLGLDMETLLATEPEAGLGNGGLGRLAACFLESLASQGYAAIGCGIRYEYGLFKQDFVDGYQVELPDNWLADGNIWEVPDIDDQMEVHFGGHITEDWSRGRLHIVHEGYDTVLAVPYDMPLAGYASDAIVPLRLWSAKAPGGLDLGYFSQGDYLRSTQQGSMAEVISKVLYPVDRTEEGRRLRLKQYYFFTSATVQYILKDFKRTYPELPLHRLPDKVAIHINDTHPVLVIPELMRILLDEEGLSWGDAWDITQRCCAYTNHTVLAEALEKWPVQAFKDLLPRIYAIVFAINQKFCQHLWEAHPGAWERIGNMAIIQYEHIHMANLAIALSHKVNGVSQLHAQILRQQTFADFAALQPDKFLGITNGIVHRRWLLEANPGLRELICEAIGDGWARHPQELEKLRPFADDSSFRQKFAAVKQANKVALADWGRRALGEDMDPGSLFDCQAKRLHEYKRQLLFALYILGLYNKLRDDPEMEIRPQTFLFAAKAFPGFERAKLIIKLIFNVKAMIDAHPRIREKIKIVFLPNYSVSLAQRLIPAAELSEQISTAGKEASGTGNMKFMMNGALTIGTMDGANVEISQAVGEENMFIFGCRENQIAEYVARNNYHPFDIYERDPELHRIVGMLKDGSLSPGQPNLFYELFQSLLYGEGGNRPDPYFLLADFRDYCTAHARTEAEYGNPDVWWKKAVLNTAMSGVFSSDRTIQEYNDQIWHLPPLF